MTQRFNQDSTTDDPMPSSPIKTAEEDGTVMKWEGLSLENIKFRWHHYELFELLQGSSVIPEL